VARAVRVVSPHLTPILQTRNTTGVFLKTEVRGRCTYKRHATLVNVDECLCRKAHEYWLKKAFTLNLVPRKMQRNAIPKQKMRFPCASLNCTFEQHLSKLILFHVWPWFKL